MTVLRLTAEQPQRVSHVVTAGGCAHSMAETSELAALAAGEVQRMASDWPKYVGSFMALIFNEPHSTKPCEDGVNYGWAGTGAVGLGVVGRTIARLMAAARAFASICCWCDEPGQRQAVN